MEKPAGIPTATGCYLFRDEKGRIVYVGKARNLASRLANYFGAVGSLTSKTQALMQTAHSVEWIVTSNETEAFILENELIKENQPRFNIRLKDDKSYPFLAIDTKATYPAPFVTRTRRGKGVAYFGPFSHVKSLRRVIDELLQAYPLRSCQTTKFNFHQRMGRPCLLFDLQKCSGPCVGAVSPEAYGLLVRDFTAFFEGRATTLRRRLAAEMDAAAGAREYERAARARDGLAALERASQDQVVVLDDDSELDAVALARDVGRAAVSIFHIRSGRIVGRSIDIVELGLEETDDEVVQPVLVRRYGEGATVPTEFLVPDSVLDRIQIAHFLATVRGRPVRVSTPQRGRRASLLELGVADAQEALRRDAVRRATDHNVRAQALQSLGTALGMAVPPYRIECFDMSHLQGTNYVGSMVVFQDGLPAKRFYRHFTIKDVDGNNDVGAMREVLMRRLRHVNADGGDRNFPNPDLIIVDGGLPQLGATMTVVDEAGLTDQIRLAALAKREELLYVPGTSTPIRLERGDEALYLIQRLRDEAHRFAISFHRTKRGKAMVLSVLDGIQGLGPARQERLMDVFGSLENLRTRTLDELRALSWLPPDVAERLYHALQAQGLEES
jgi:excinuclease ABC subunit C